MVLLYTVKVVNYMFIFLIIAIFHNQKGHYCVENVAETLPGALTQYKD